MPYQTEKSVCKFLHIFSRFEYALKKNNFLKKGVRGNAEADWDKFAKSLDKKISLDAINSKEFQTSTTYFFNHPPKKQIVDDNSNLGWKDETIAKKQRNFEKLLVLVRRVRNNLFHGGKFHGEYIHGLERNKKLIKFSIVILMECLKPNDEIEKEFRQ